MRLLIRFCFVFLGVFFWGVGLVGAVELPGTPDVEVSGFAGRLLINEVSFKDSDGDWVELYVLDDGFGGDGVNLKGFSLWDDRAFKEIDDFFVKTGDYFWVEFNSGEADQFPVLKVKKKGLVGTTEQVVLKDSVGNILDAVCWSNGAETSSEANDVEQLIDSNGWSGACIESGQVKTKMVIGRMNFNDSDEVGDWMIVSPTPGEENELLVVEEVGKKTSKLKSEVKSFQDGDLSTGIQITELLPNPLGTDGGQEWVEIVNAGEKDVGLGNWRLKYDNGKNEREYVFADQVRLSVGEVYLISDLGFSLGNSGGELVLSDFEGNRISSVKYEKALEGQSFNRIESEGGEEVWEWMKAMTPGASNQRLVIESGRVVADLQSGEYSFLIDSAEGETEVFFRESVLPFALANVLLVKGAVVEIEGYKNDRGLELQSLREIEVVRSSSEEGFDWGLWGMLLVIITFGGVKLWGLEKFRSVFR